MTKFQKEVAREVEMRGGVAEEVNRNVESERNEGKKRDKS
jgi:hypothetical protein